MLSDEGTSPILSLGTPPPRVPMLVRIREELKKAEEDHHVRAVILRINSPGGTVTASDIVYREIETFKQRSRLPVLECAGFEAAPSSTRDQGHQR